MEEGLSLLLIFVFLVLTAFFVASEFAVVKVRRTRIEQLINEGKKRASHVKIIIDNLDEYLSACQLGITITSLVLGWLGEPAIQKLLQPAFERLELGAAVSHTASFVIAFSIVTFLHVVLGELVPKTLAIQKAEQVAMVIAKPLLLFYKMAFPFIWTLNKSAMLVARMFGLQPVKEEETHSEEEIKLIVSNSSELEPDEQKMLNKIFDFDQRFVREVMVHRKEIVCLYDTDPIDENIKLMKESKHSRFPVCGEDRDDIKGYINIKDIYGSTSEINDLNDFVRSIPKFLETTTISKTLKLLQQEKSQIAIVMDEYGGVSGMITLEDIFEEIVGEIQDEYDDEEDPIQPIENGFLVGGDVLLAEINEELGLQLEEIDGFDTIAGYVMTKFERMPEKNDVLEEQNYQISVEEVEEDRILKLKFIKSADPTIE